MTSSEVMMLQRELHKLAEQNREDHKLVRQALGKLQGDMDKLSDRLHSVEDTDKQIAAVEQDRQARFKRTLAIAATLASVAGVISGIIVAAANQL
jgi:hypothetical protein